MKTPVYLDYNATTPTDPKVLEAMLPYFTERFGNPSSAGHAFGWMADEAVQQAKEQLGTLLSAEPETLIFTSGATEAVNLAIKGAAAARQFKGHIVTFSCEHEAVLAACQRLMQLHGIEVTFVDPEPDGRVRVEAVEAALRDDTFLVALMWANNETGVIQPVREVAHLARKHGALFLTDATQAVGKIPVDVAEVDLLACSSHKFYGPKGVGALYVRRRVRCIPQIDGGGQQNGWRSGTLNVPGIVGMGKAAEVAAQTMDTEARRLAALRDRLETALMDALPNVKRNGDGERLPNTTNLSFCGLRASNLFMTLRDLAVSGGSACQSSKGHPSHVLTSMGVPREDAFAAARFSLGRSTTEEDVDFAIQRVTEAVHKLLAMKEDQAVPTIARAAY